MQFLPFSFQIYRIISNMPNECRYVNQSKSEKTKNCHIPYIPCSERIPGALENRNTFNPFHHFQCTEILKNCRKQRFQSVPDIFSKPNGLQIRSQIFYISKIIENNRFKLFQKMTVEVSTNQKVGTQKMPHQLIKP